MGRIVTGLILAIGWLLLLLVGTYPLFCLVITAGGGMALYEFLRMSTPEVEQKHIPLVLILGIFPLARCFPLGQRRANFQPVSGPAHFDHCHCCCVSVPG